MARSGDLPTPWANPNGNAHTRPPSPASKVASIVVFAVMSAILLFGTATYIGTLIISSAELNAPGVVTLTVGLVALAGCWLWSLRSMRRRLGARGTVAWRRPTATRPHSGRIRTVIWLSLRLTPPARTPIPLTQADIDEAARMPVNERDRITTGGRRAGIPLSTRLADIERAIGDALYQLDMATNEHELTKDQIAEIRTLGIRASAWLSAHAHQANPPSPVPPSPVAHRPVPLSPDQSSPDQSSPDPPSPNQLTPAQLTPAQLAAAQVADGITRYATLAQAATNLLTARASATDVLQAKRHLALLIDREHTT